MQSPASINSMEQSMKVVSDVPVRLPMRSMTKICQNRTMPMITHLFPVSIFLVSWRTIKTHAAPSAKQEMTANFSVFRMFNCQTLLMGRIKIKRSVRTLVMMSDLRTKIWSIQCPVRMSDHCWLIGLQRKMKMKVKMIAQATTIAAVAKIQMRI